MRVKFKIYEMFGDVSDFVGEEVLELGSIKLGRNHLEGGLYVPIEGVSRLHAIIDCVKDGGELFVIDLASEHGTFVNGKRADKERLTIWSGDEVRLGPRAVINVTFPEPVYVEYIPPSGPVGRHG